MKYRISLLFIAVSISLFSQQIDYNTQKGFIAEGYDVVTYFTEKEPLKGNKKFQLSHEGAKFKFVSEKNLNLFKESPDKYIPQYGGFCAYAIAAKSTKMNIDAEEYDIRDGKLYLFYSSWISSKLTNWRNEDTKKLQHKGDENWEKLKYKNK